MSDFEMYITRIELDAMAREILEKTGVSIEYKNGYADACDDLKEYIKKMMKESI